MYKMYALHFIAYLLIVQYSIECEKAILLNAHVANWWQIYSGMLTVFLLTIMFH
jgi:hypothetical protein